MPSEPFLLSPRDLALALRHLPRPALVHLRADVDRVLSRDDADPGRPDRPGLTHRRVLTVLQTAVAEALKA